jgi:imidazolonepropionase-like amidohydrolase
VAEHVGRGVDVIKVMASGGMLTPGTSSFGTQFDDGELRSLVGAAHDAGLAVRAHAHSVAGIRHAIAAGVDGIEHFTGLSPDGLRLPDDLLEDVATAGIEVCPTAGGDPALIPPHDRLPPGLRGALEELGLTLPGLLEQRAEHYRRMRAHGVRVVTGLDAGISPSKRHGALWFAVSELVDGGYSIAEALTTATSGAAASCGLAGVTGSLRRGHTADLLVVDGDLSADVSALGRPVSVLVRGVVP